MPRCLHLVLIACWLACTGGPAWAQRFLDRTWSTDGHVFGMARSGNTLYIGGWFNLVGTPTGGGIPLDPISGEPVAGFPRVCGSVDVAIPDGCGGWFIGGYFDHVEGEPRAHLAHVLADGRLSPWSPAIAGRIAYNAYDPIHPVVRALALRGNRLYVGGVFTSVDGEARNNLASFDTSTEELLPWSPGANGQVRCLVAHGERLYVGGYFTAIGDSARGGLAAFREHSGELTGWNPNADRAVLTLAIKGQTLYVGGQFDQVGGLARNSVAAVDLESGAVTGWDAGLKPPRYYIAHGNWSWPFVQGLAVKGNAVYLSGWFTDAGGQPRASIAALDSRTAVATDFDALLGPWEGGYVLANCLALRGNTVYVGGAIGSAGGEPRANLAALDAHSGAVMPWNPRAAGPYHKDSAAWDPRMEGSVVALVVGGDRVYAGGSLTNMYDWQRRTGLAALDLTTGRVLPWSPEVEGLYLTKLTTAGNAVYMTGAFRKVNGEIRENVAALDGATGALLPWYRDYVYTLATYGDSLYASGSLTVSPGVYRDYVGPIDPVTAGLDGWLAYPDRAAESMLATDSTIYFGGALHSIEDEPRLLYAAVDRRSGAVLPWAPRVKLATGGGYWTFALERVGAAVYLAGRFVEVGGEPRVNLAAVNAWTGDVLPWAPNPNDLVFALAASGSTVWAGGRFGVIGGEARGHLAALDVTTGAVLPWDSHADGEVNGLIASGDTLFVAGAFRQLGGFPHGGVAMVVTEAPAAATLAVGAAAPAEGTLRTEPNPLSGAGRLRFTLPKAATVTLAVFDLQGRRVQTLMDHEWRPAGPHELGLRSSGWAPGVYLCRLEAGGLRATTRLLVVR